MVGTQFTGVHLSKQNQKSIEFFDEVWRNLFWETSSYHMKESPAIVAEFLPRNMMFSNIQYFLLLIGLFCFHFFFG